MGAMESNAVAFTACIRHHVVRSIDIEQGRAAALRLRAAGLITFTEDRRSALEASRPAPEPEPVVRRTKLNPRRTAHRISAMMTRERITVKQASAKVGVNYRTALKWCELYTGQKYKLTPQKLQRAIELINDESHSMTTAAHELGCTLGALSNYLRARGYKYDRETCLVSEAKRRA